MMQVGDGVSTTISKAGGLSLHEGLYWNLPGCQAREPHPFLLVFCQPTQAVFWLTEDQGSAGYGLVTLL